MDDARVSDEGFRETTRKTLLTFWNVFSFFATYADLDGWAPSDEPVAPTHLLDRWILNGLHDTVGVVTTALDEFDALTRRDPDRHPSSTTSRTGTSAAVAPGSGRRYRSPTRLCTGVWW